MWRVAWPEALRNRKLAHPFLVALFLPGGIARRALNKCMHLEEGRALARSRLLRSFLTLRLGYSDPLRVQCPPRRSGNPGTNDSNR